MRIYQKGFSLLTRTEEYRCLDSSNLFRRFLSRMIQGSKWLTEGDSSDNAGKAYVRSVDGDERLRISLKYIRPENNGIKFFNFERLKAEPLLSTLQRMTNNIQKEIKPANKKSKKAAKSATQDANGSKEASPVPCESTADNAAQVGEIVLLRDGEVLNASGISNAEAWSTATELKIGETVYQLVRNYPTCLLLQICDNPLANYPCPVKCHVEFAKLLDCSFEWYVSCKNKVESKITADLVGVLHKNWNKVSDGFSYTPTEDDIGCHLLLKCTPHQKASDGSVIAGEPQLSQSIQPVSPGPKDCPFERRQNLLLKKYSSHDERRNVLRVLSYNVLADCYTDMPGTPETLFAYCPPQFLTFSYRKLLLLKELPGYDADIMCLQEVDRHVFEDDYNPAMMNIGYEGRLSLKAREVKEGLALFYRRDRFDLVEVSDYFIGGSLDSDPDFVELNEKLSQVPHIREMFVTRSSVIQIANLIDKTTGESLLVANTHLYFHWSADNIRLLQSYICSRIISRTKAAITAATGKEPKVIFCGDFNSDYRCGVYRLFTKGSIPANFNEFYAGGKQNFISGLGDLIRTDLKFFSASGTPDYTTFVAGFAATIDYVYAEKHRFEVAACLPMYHEDEFLPYTALPNEFFPSDHMAVVVDLKYK